MKKIFLYAYDRQNLGDDLFIHTITKRYPEVKFYIWTNALNIQTFRMLPNLRVIDENSGYVRFLEKIRPSFVTRYKSRIEKSCAAVVYIGGSLFIEYENWRTILTWWDYEAKNRNFYILGANFGPYKTEAYRDELAKIFANTKDVCFRDHYSYAIFSEVPTVRVAPDILFGIDIPRRKKYEKRVFISVIDCKEKSEGINQFAEFEKSYLDIIVRCIEESMNNGYKVTLASFCKIEGDEMAIEKVLSMIGREDIRSIVETVNYNGTNADEILQSISDSDYIVASRFHAAILGFAASKPVLPIVYSDKTVHVLNDIGFKGQVLDIRAFCFDDFSFFSGNQSIDTIIELREKSQCHFSSLELVLR